MRATDGTCRVSHVGGAIDHIAASAVVVSACAALAIAAFLLTRRVAGGLSSPLPVLPLVLTAFVVVLWALVARQLSSRPHAFLAAAIVVLFMLALACSYPGGRPIDWLVWPAAMCTVVLCPPMFYSRGEPMSQLGISQRAPEMEVPAESGVETVLQQVNRVRTAEGSETVHGTLVAEFAAGERQKTLYVAFCPPFERLPQVEANIADESEADVKLSQVLHNGAQFEVRLPEAADESTNVTVEFFAAGPDA